MAADKESWVLQQKSQLAGNHTIYVSPKAVLIENTGNSYAILLRAPDWKVLLYNTRSKKACSVEVKEFLGSLTFGSGMLGEGGYLQALPLRKAGTEESLKGLKAIRYSTGRMATAGNTRRRDVRNSIFDATDLVTADYWLWPCDPGLQQAGVILQKIYRFPRRPGIPLALQYEAISGQKCNELETLSVRKAEIMESKFLPPKGLVMAKTEHDVVFDDQKNKKINRAAEMFDSWRDTWDR